MKRFDPGDGTWDLIDPTVNFDPGQNWLDPTF